jgi:hypothetical protein
LPEPSICSVSGYFCVSHAGGVSVGVPTTTLIPYLFASRTARTSQSMS